MGDFNADLLKIDTNDDTNYFYNIMKSQCFRPLVLQPTRVTSSSATLIDNIFLNDMSINSLERNITSSISDHLTQFCSLDISSRQKVFNKNRKGRSFKNFNHDEFKHELSQINWNDLFRNKNCNDKVSIFLEKIDYLLDEMAPVRNLKRSPWLTIAILMTKLTINF